MLDRKEKELLINEIKKLDRSQLQLSLADNEINNQEDAIKYFFCLIRLTKIAHQSMNQVANNEIFLRKLSLLKLHLLIPQSNRNKLGKRIQVHVISLMTDEGLELANNRELYKKREFSRRFKTFEFNEYKLNKQIPLEQQNLLVNDINEDYSLKYQPESTARMAMMEPVNFFNVPPSLAHLAAEYDHFHQLNDIFLTNGNDETYIFNYPLEHTIHDMSQHPANNNIYRSDNLMTFFSHKKNSLCQKIIDITSEDIERNHEIDSVQLYKKNY